MNQMNQVNFAGYNYDWVGPYRTIAKKFDDFGAIDKKMQELNATNSTLKKNIETLRQKITSIVQSVQNVKGVDQEAAKAEIAVLNSQISKMEEEINTNKNLYTTLWYSYHERV